MRAGRGGSCGTFADFEADVVPVNRVHRWRWECHIEKSQRENVKLFV